MVLPLSRKCKNDGSIALHPLVAALLQCVPFNFHSVLAGSMSKEQEKQLHKHLSTLLRQLYEMEVIAGDFTQPNSQQMLVNKMQEFTEGLEQFKQLAGAFSTAVPTALLRHIDQGGHPDDFIRKTFRTAVGENQLAAGRVAALQALQQELEQAAAKVFPEETKAYTAVVTQKQEELRQQEQQQQPAGAGAK